MSRTAKTKARKRPARAPKLFAFERSTLEQLDHMLALAQRLALDAAPRAYPNTPGSADKALCAYDSIRRVRETFAKALRPGGAT